MATAFNASAARRIPPIQCLLTFEALARLRSVTQTADELCVTPSAVSHRVKQLEQILGTRLFGRADFSLTTEGWLPPMERRLLTVAGGGVSEMTVWPLLSFHW